MPIIADDFGLSTEDNNVILDLLETSSLGGTSVLIRGEISNNNISRLTKIREEKNIQVGIHLNLTEKLKDQQFHDGILNIWIKSILGMVNFGEIQNELNDQFKLFKHTFKFSPDFVDGHQHCHEIPKLWPVIRTCIKSHTNNEVWVRNTCPKDLLSKVYQLRQGGLKSLLIIMWGANIRKKLIAANIRTNRDFMGTINYDPLSFHKRYTDSLNRYKGNVNCVMMVHPGSDCSAYKLSNHPTECRVIEAELLKNRSAKITLKNKV